MKLKIIFIMTTCLLLLCIFLLLLLLSNSRSKKISVYVIPHSHDDVGWLKTMDAYYMQRPHCVKCILDNIAYYLKENSDRTFVYAEISFFEKWYSSQSETIQEDIKQFVKEGRLEFTNGGWVMNDEACPLSQDIIDQMRLGLQFLYKEFNYIPTVAWYLDPFGHSKTNAALMAKLGFENLVIVRIDYKEKEIRKAKQELEFIWKPYDDIDNGKTKIFTHITFGHYSPKGLWDNFLERRAPSNENYFDDVAKELYDDLYTKASAYKTNNLLFLYGDDFTFADDSAPFINMEKVINYFKNSNKWKDLIEIHYSTPKKYFEDIKKDSSMTWPELKNYDFFPYSDGAKAYWTGYFTSRPYLKGYIRDVRKYLYHSSIFFLRQNFSKDGINKDRNFIRNFIEELYEMRKALAVGQHHDGVSGTARELVSEDYISMMEKSVNKIKNSLSQLLSDTTDKVNICIPTVAEFGCYDKNYAFTDKVKEQIFFIANLESNAGIPIHLKINTDKIKIFDVITNAEINYDIFCYDAQKTEFYISILLNFSNSLDPETEKKSFHILKVVQDNSNDANSKSIDKLTFKNDNSEFITLYDNEEIQIQFNIKQGFKHKIKKENVEYNYSIKYGKYNSNGPSTIRGNSDNPAGAYILAPSTEFPYYEEIDIEKSFYFNGKQVFHIILKFPWCSTRIYIYKNTKFNEIIEIKTVMEPLKGNNNEYVLIVASDIDNKNPSFDNLEFFTDTNGSTLIQRIKDYRFGWTYSKDEIVADNFYPVNSVISINDANNKRVLSVWNDRSQAATSISKGEIYFILNRVSTVDDRRGLADGVYERRNSHYNYHYSYLITLGKKINKKFIHQILNKRPIILNLVNDSTDSNQNYSQVTNKLSLSLEQIAKLHIDFIIYDKNSRDCFETEFFIIDENTFLMQVSSPYSDLYFTNEKRKCKFRLNYELLHESFKVIEVELNGLVKVPSVLISDKLRGFSSFRETKAIYLDYTLFPFESKTFLIKKIL